MRYLVLASDYDGTLAHNGRVDAPTVAALQRLLATGRRLVLVTGRELPELLPIFPEIDLFEWVVAENGALLYKPATKEETRLADPPPERFVEMLKARGVGPISVGRVIVATWEPHENTVLETIRDLGFEMQVIFNKGAVMVLPAGVNKAFGFKAALKQMGLSPHNAVGVGDAENDHALLRLCEFSVAVSNALPAVKETADMVTTADHGAGVTQLIDRVIETDLQEFDGRLERHHLVIGKTHDDQDAKITPYGPSILMCGPSASGKSTVATSILEALSANKYQYCIIDPEGDYETLEGVVVLGGPQGPPVVEEALQLLEKPDNNLVISMTGMPIPDRPPFFLKLLPQLLNMRAHTGRPHWLILDEVHHLMPSEWQPPTGMLPSPWHNALLITVHPELLAKPCLERIGRLLAVGQNVEETVISFARAMGIAVPDLAFPDLEQGEAWHWGLNEPSPPTVIKVKKSQTDRRRHRRKYAEGELPPDRSFYFKGPEGKLNIRVQNLMLFLQVADGVDDETWDFHLHNGDFAGWFRDNIKDDALAAEAQRIAAEDDLEPTESRALIRTAIEKDYTLPASPPLPVPGAG